MYIVNRALNIGKFKKIIMLRFDQSSFSVN
eukprot:SAG31_NODE_9699_length_1240_cov_1.452235_3_plen_29_part_01